MPETNSAKILHWLQDHLGEHLKLLIIPYKRDMWDSLEGIYNIANSTPGCSAHVMPIPYTLKCYSEPRWIMDDWSDIDCRFAVEYQKKPKKGEYDAILFHNPYDNVNRVTTVHPAFYSDRLKGLSRALCVVPYGIGTIALITPGTINADIVFCENDTIIESFKRQIMDEGATEEEAAFICRKMINLGSPKYDLNLNQQIPPEWIQRIKGKKVILICTSLQCFLNDPATEMLNVNNVINEYSKRDDYCIIWREHPLMKATIMTMRPQYIQTYGKFQKNYEEQGLGILDKTNDYRIAFSVADVLYSDPSSLTSIWETTGKELHIL